MKRWFLVTMVAAAADMLANALRLVGQGENIKDTHTHHNAQSARNRMIRGLQGLGSRLVDSDVYRGRVEVAGRIIAPPNPHGAGDECSDGGPVP